MLNYLILIIFLFITSIYGEEKVRPDYTEIGLEEPTKIEYSSPELDRYPSHLNVPSYRFTLSPNYTFWPFREDKKWSETGVSFVYIGIYDFYHGTRSSGPVVSRKQNPLIYFFTQHKYQDHILKLKLGFGHESNGQFIDSKESHQYFQEAFNDSIHGGSSDDKLLYYQYNIDDYVGIGWNYYLAEFSVKRDKPFNTNAHFTFKLLYKLFVGYDTFDPTTDELEDDIFYDPELSNKTSIKGYDGFIYSIDWQGNSRHFNFMGDNYLIYDPSFTIGLKHGYFGYDFKPTIWIKGYMKLFGSLPTFYQYDNGYGRDLSSYPFRYRSHSFGIEFNFE